MSAAPPPVSLSETGTIYVTHRAAEEYAAARGLDRLQHEEARRALTALLLDATRRADNRDGSEGWRIRSRTIAVDVTAHVRRQERLAVVVCVHARPYDAPRYGRDRP